MALWHEGNLQKRQSRAAAGMLVGTSSEHTQTERWSNSVEVTTLHPQAIATFGVVPLLVPGGHELPWMHVERGQQHLS